MSHIELLCWRVLFVSYKMVYLTYFEVFGIYSHAFFMVSLTLFGFLGFTVMCFSWFHWLYLDFWESRSCVFSGFIDSIWIFGIYGQLITPISLTSFGLLGFTGNLLLYFYWLISVFYNMQSIQSYIYLLLAFKHFHFTLFN